LDSQRRRHFRGLEGSEKTVGSFTGQADFEI
jgi:hypothetical protein